MAEDFLYDTDVHALLDKKRSYEGCHDREHRSGGDEFAGREYERLAGFDHMHPRWDGFLAAAILGVLGTGAAYVLNHRLIVDEGTTASVVTYLLPVVAVALGATVLSEPFTAPVIAGMVIVLVGVALARRATATGLPSAKSASQSAENATIATAGQGTSWSGAIEDPGLVPHPA
ncbi:hypothetical protein GCM10022226_02400 [Sphaerisporangium flaviroseum]|uniref:EamA domain-containing protein n=1 Tax=Sphaerisporangium flaviroseum TaxID=509199 RepID=A0ABP7HFC8_9ACTN